MATSFAASAMFGAAGMRALVTGPQPEKTLELYEFEGCPFCRKVRVALSEMDLDATVFPCPKNGPRFREEVRRRGGKAQFPYLVDPNTGDAMYESDDIVRHLANRYREGRIPLSVRLGPLSTTLSSLSSLPRVARGSFYRPARAPEKPLELYSFEASPYCRIAREALSELELPYLLHNVAKGSPRRPDFVARSGKMMVPYLIDPNTGKEMFESADIVRYLNDTYAA